MTFKYHQVKSTAVSLDSLKVGDWFTNVDPVNKPTFLFRKGSTSGQNAICAEISDTSIQAYIMCKDIYVYPVLVTGLKVYADFRIR